MKVPLLPMEEQESSPVVFVSKTFGTQPVNPATPFDPSKRKMRLRRGKGKGNYFRKTERITAVMCNQKNMKGAFLYSFRLELEEEKQKKMEKHALFLFKLLCILIEETS